MTEGIPEENLKKDVTVSAIYILFTLLMVVGGFYTLTALGGLTEEIDRTRFWFFSAMFLVFDVAIITFKIGKNTFLKSTSWAKHIYFPIHDPEYGIFKGIKFLANPFNVLILSVLLFTILGFVGSVFPQSSEYLFPLAAGQVSQQTTPEGKLFFGFFNAVPENTFLYIILFTFVTLLSFILRRFNIPYQAILIIVIIIGAPLASYAWGAIHTGVSGSDEVRGFGHLLFGFNGGLLTLTTGSIIPFDVYHIINNIFYRAREVYGSEVTIFVFIALIILEIILVSLYFYTRSKIRGTNEIIDV